MGHKNADMDCMGAALGVVTCAKHIGSRAFIVLDSVNSTIRDFVDRLREDPAYIYARQIFDTINAKRSAGGLKAFVWNDRVYLAAQARAKEISGENCFTHTRPDGTNYSTVLTEYKVESTIRNEIIAHGYTTAQPLVDTWASTSSTSPVILALVYSQAAVGVFQAESAKEGEEGKYYYALLVIG